MTDRTPALARLGAGPLALAQPSPGRDWVAWAETRAADALSPKASDEGIPTDRAVEQWQTKGVRPYLMHQGVAVIPVIGLLLKRLGRIEYPWATGYAETGWQLSVAMADSEARAVAFWIDSPGGMVDGLFNLTASIRAARGTKPIVGVVDGCGCSAAYAIAAATESISADAHATVGSVGVIGVHWDFSGMLEEFGLRPTLIFSGARKADGNPYQPLPDEVAARWQAEIDELRAVFAADVAEGRGGAITVDAVLATEAATYAVPSAIETARTLGLIDAVAAPELALAALAGAVAAPAIA